MGARGVLTQYRSCGPYRPFDRLASKRIRQLCGSNALAPASYTTLGERISIVCKFPVPSGGFGDV